MLLLLLLASLLLLHISSLACVNAKNSDNQFLSKCVCASVRVSPHCDFSSLSKAKLRKLVDRLMGSQVVCVEAQGYVIPTFTSALSPLASVLAQGQAQGQGQTNAGFTTELSGLAEAETVRARGSTTATATIDDGDDSTPSITPSRSDTDRDRLTKSKSKSKNTKKKQKQGAGEDHVAASRDSSQPVVQQKDDTSQTSLSSHDRSIIANKRKFINTVPKQCTLDGFSCSTDTGLELLFPTAIVMQELITDAFSFKMNEELKQLMLDLEEEDEGCKFNLHGGYRSQDGFMSRKEPSVQWLRGQIIPRIQNLLKISNATHLQFSVDGWGAVLRGGHSQNLHVHPGSMYAGIYYASAQPEISTSGKSGGCLSFVDPRNGVNMAQVVRGKNIYGEAIEICPGPRGGLLVIFPSWLLHEVKTIPEHYTGYRVGISFNAVYKP